MTHPRVPGRKLPRQDWEGDDFKPPVTKSRFVTCQDTACGRCLAWATNGTVDLDGKLIRAAITPRDPDGVTMEQVADAIKRLTNPDRILRWSHWSLDRIRQWLLEGRGLVVNGHYDKLAEPYRFQVAADFNHAIFIPYRSRTSGYRDYDPLDPNLDHHGVWTPPAAIEPFIMSLGGLVGWIDLEPVLLTQ